MGLTNSEYEAVMREYDSIRYRNAELRDRRTKEVFARLPMLKELNDEIITDFAKLATDALVLNSADYKSAREKLDRKVTEFAGKRQELLVSNGYTGDYLEHIYSCPLCKDTGFINGIKCECFTRIAAKHIYSGKNIYMMADEKADFKNFVTDYYRMDDFDNDTECSSRENAMDAFSRLKSMADDFENNSRNFVLYGGVGVGKTFLASCLTNSLIKSGHSVVFLTAFRFFNIFENYTFHRDDAEDGKVIPSTEPVFDCDLLVLDDIGTEVSNAFTTSKLFECINERILNNKPTIISSNWSPAYIKANYSDRIFSRLIKHYKFLKLTGDDIRMAL